MANLSHVEILRQGTKALQGWRENHPDHVLDLSGADLSKAQLEGVNLTDANLSDANLCGAQLEWADLFRVNLSRARLEKANLQETRLFGADLTSANLTRANLAGAILSGANLTDADLREADLRLSHLVEANLTRTNLTGCRVYGISAWKVNVEGTIQRDLIITPDGEQIVTVDDLNVAQFMYLILENANIRNVIDTMGKRAVLVLGRFSGRMHILSEIRDRLRALGFLPIVFDFERPAARDFTETVKTLAGLSAFMIADITAPRSVPKELEATVPDCMVPLVPFIERGEEPYSMFVDLQNRYDWVLEIVTYSDEKQLSELIEPMAARAWDERHRLLERRTQAIRIRDGATVIRESNRRDRTGSASY